MAMARADELRKPSSRRRTRGSELEATYMMVALLPSSMFRFADPLPMKINHMGLGTILCNLS